MSSRISVSKHGLLRRCSSVAVVATMLLNSSIYLSASSGSASSSVPVGTLSVVSDPAGASVYVDGKLAGQTPLSAAQLPVGEHRVRVVKEGYLENGRIVAIAVGESKSVDVKLTKYSGTATAAAATGGGGNFFLSPLGIAIIAGAVVAVILVTRGGKPPVAGTITTLSGDAVAAGHAFTVTGASDPGGKTLTFTWDFGDGGTATGLSVTHAFATAGTFTVKVKVSNGSKSAEATATVTTRSLSGTWKGTLSGFTGITFTFVITQSGGTLTGTYSDNLGPFIGNISGTVSGTGTLPINFQVNITNANILPYSLHLASDAAVNVLAGNATETGAAVPPIANLIRQ